MRITRHGYGTTHDGPNLPLTVETDKTEILALLQFCSKDDARLMMADPAINSAGEIAATDGHTAIVIGEHYYPTAADWRRIPRSHLEIAAKTQPARGSITLEITGDTLTITVRDKSEHAITRVADISLATEYPPIGKVYPRHDAEPGSPLVMAPPDRAAFNADLLARMAKAQKALGLTGIHVIPSGRLDPWYLVAQPRFGPMWSAIIMPMDFNGCPIPEIVGGDA